MSVTRPEGFRHRNRQPEWCMVPIIAAQNRTAVGVLVLCRHTLRL